MRQVLTNIPKNMTTESIIRIVGRNPQLPVPTTVFDEFPQMEEFYQESKGLVSVTVDSVKLFKSKVDGFVATYPLAVEHEKYPLIQENIKVASFRLTITFIEEWNGETHINFWPNISIHLQRLHKWNSVY